jgi:hypothetical protein
MTPAAGAAGGMHTDRDSKLSIHPPVPASAAPSSANVFTSSPSKEGQFVNKF